MLTGHTLTRCLLPGLAEACRSSPSFKAKGRKGMRVRRRYGATHGLSSASHWREKKVITQARRSGINCYGLSAVTGVGYRLRQMPQKKEHIRQLCASDGVNLNQFLTSQHVEKLC